MAVVSASDLLVSPECGMLGREERISIMVPVPTFNGIFISVNTRINHALGIAVPTVIIRE